MGVRKDGAQSCAGWYDDWSAPPGLAQPGTERIEASNAADTTSDEANAAASAADEKARAGTGVASASGVKGVAGDGSTENSRASYGASVGAGAACVNAFSADRFGTTAIAEIDVCIFGANIEVMKLNVDNVVHDALVAKSTLVQPFPGMNQGDDLETNLSWLVCGADRLSGKWPEHHIFSYNAACWVKVQASEVSKALNRVPAPSWDHSKVLRIFIEFCDLVASDEGRLPLGVVLGYMAITGTPAVHHSYQDTFGHETCYILPKDKDDGTSMLPDIVKTGGQLCDKGNDET